MPEFIVQRDEQFERVSVPGDEVVFGREEGVDLRLDDGSVSRRHARVRRRDGRWVLEDLDSGNGTLVDGRKIARVSIERGFDFAIGPFTVTFLGSPDGSQEPVDSAAVAAGAAESPPRATSVSVDDSDDYLRAPRLDGSRVGAELEPGLFGPRWALKTADGDDGVVTRIAARWWSEPGFEAWLDENLAAWKDMAGVDIVRARRESEKGAEHANLLIETRAGHESLIERRRGTRRVKQRDSAELLLQLLDTVERFHDRDRFLWGLRPECVRYGDGDRVVLGFTPIPRFGLEATPEGVARSLNALPLELIETTGEPGRRTDVFGLGAVIHFWLLGAPVADGKTYETIRQRIEKGIYKSPRDRRPELVEDFGELVGEMIALDPAERPAELGGIRIRARAIRDRAGDRPERRPESVKLDAREREPGESSSAPPRSAGFQAAKLAILGAMFLLANGLVFYLLKNYLFD